MDKDSIVLIITGGKIEDSFLREQLNREQYSMIIAADHGLNTADRLSIPVDFIVGDFDSVEDKVLQKYRKLSTPIQTFPTEKDKTDTQIAIELALMHNPGRIEIVGATGSRLDHVLANIHLLMLPMQVNIDAYLIDSNNKVYLKNKSFAIKKDIQYGEYISLLPFSEKVSGLTLKGFKYPLHHITYSSGCSLGISNEIKDDVGEIELVEGTLLVIEAKD